MPLGKLKIRPAMWALACLCVLSSLSFIFVTPDFTVAASGCSTSRTDFTPDTEEAALIGKVNDYRVQSGLGRLAVSRTLMAAAAWKSNDLGVHNYFGHDDLDRSWSQRLQDCGYSYPQIAENLAAGGSDAASTFELWRSSTGHNANMLDASIAAKVIGVARARVPGSTYGWYWTADFGGVVEGSAGTTSASSTSPTIVTTTRLAIGSTATVTGTGSFDCLNVHSGPGSAADVVSCLPDGTSMIVTDGPVSADGYVWLKLGNLGWAVSEYLTPASPFG